MTQQNITLALATSTENPTAVSLRSPTTWLLRKSFKMSLTCLASVAVLVASLPARADASLLNGLVAYYDFNQSSGSILPNVYGVANSGVLNNMDNSDWVAGQTGFGNALDFDGSNDFVHIANGYTDTVSGDNTHTISMWYYPRSYGGDPVILDAEDGGGFDYFVEFSTGLKVYYGVGGAYRNYTGTAPALNAWHNLVLTKTGAGDSGDVYLDGTKLLAFGGSLNSTPTLTSDLLLGKYKSGNYNFNGLIDDVAFWNRNLSDDEVTSLYGTGTDLSGIVFVPEPSTLSLLGLGVFGLAVRTRRRRIAA